jgi:hypothetical protein
MFNILIDWILVFMLLHVAGITGISIVFARQLKFAAAIPYVIYGFIIGNSAFQRVSSQSGNIAWNDPASTGLVSLFGSNEVILGLCGLGFTACTVKLYQAGGIGNFPGFFYHTWILMMVLRNLIARLIRMNYPGVPLNNIPDHTLQFLNNPAVAITTYLVAFILFLWSVWHLFIRERVNAIIYLHRRNLIKGTNKKINAASIRRVGRVNQRFNIYNK